MTSPAKNSLAKTAERYSILTTKNKPIRLKRADAEAVVSTPGNYRVYIDSGVADELLKFNTHNRKLVEGDVLKWAYDMENGRWKYNGEAFKISSDRVILDGQHRLTALGLTKNKLIEVLIITGLAPESQATMDQGRRRSADEQLTLQGVQMDPSRVAALKQYIQWADGWMGKETKDKRAQLTTPRIIEWANSNADVISRVTYAQKYKKIKATPAALLSAFAIIDRENNRTNADEFFTKLMTGVNLEQGSPILALRNRLDVIQWNRIRVSAKDQIGLIISTFNLWRKGESRNSVRVPSGGWTSDTFPKVVKT